MTFVAYVSGNMRGKTILIICLIALIASCKKSNPGGLPGDGDGQDDQGVRLFMTKVANNTGYAISEFVFDNKGILRNIIQRDGTYSIQCNASGQMIKKSFGKYINEYEYDTNKRLVKIKGSSPTGSIHTTTFEYNSQGKITKSTSNNQSGGMSIGSTVTYTWNGENITKRVWVDAVETWIEEYTYDDKINPYYVDPNQIHLADRGEPSSKNNAVRTLINRANVVNGLMKKEFKYNSYGYATSWMFLDTGYLYGLVFTYKQL